MAKLVQCFLHSGILQNAIVKTHKGKRHSLFFYDPNNIQLQKVFTLLATCKGMRARNIVNACLYFSYLLLIVADSD